VDPRSILATIMLDQGAPATARVSAARALLAANHQDTKSDREAERRDAVNSRALELLRKPH
jgi:hypothetical protein